MDTFGTSRFVLYREVFLSLEVKMYQYNRERTLKCVLYREVFLLFGVSRGSTVVGECLLLPSLCTVQTLVCTNKKWR